MAKIIALIFLVVLAVIFGPMITIWTLSLLFGFAIPVTLATRFATLWLTAFVVRNK